MIDRRIEELLPFAAAGSLPPEEQALVEAAAASDQEVARELEALRAVGAAVKASETPQSPGEFGWARLQRDLHKSADPGAGARGSAVWRWAAIAAGLVIVAETAALTALTLRRDNDILVAAGDTGPRRADVIMQVTFKPEAKERDIRALLLEVRGTIADGPSAIGVYKLSFRTQAEARAAREALVAHPDIVEFAEVE